MTLFGRFLPVLMLVGVVAGCGGGPAPQSPSASPAGGASITFANAAGREVLLHVEIASTPDERSRGLMFRDELPEDNGMLFVFQSPANTGFWMKDTRVPLSVAFLDSGGKIIDIQDMQPLSTQIHHAPAPYFFAVEANQGWFGKNGIRAGDRTRLPARTATPR